MNISAIDTINEDKKTLSSAQSLIDRELKLSACALEKFNNDGYLIIPPCKQTTTLLRDGSQYINSYLPSWQDGFDEALYSQLPDPHLRTNFTYKNLLFRGCALADRRRSGALPDKRIKNAFYGQRGVLRGHKAVTGMSLLAENKVFLETVKQLLNTDQLILHNFSLNNVYPGHTGDDGCFHSDLSGFANDPITAFDRGEKYILAIVYLSDVDKNVAPLRVYPGSHKIYKQVNGYIKSLLGKGHNDNYISNIRNYLELMPNFVSKPVDIVGPAGSVVLVDNTILHNPTANTSTGQVRSALFCTYSSYSATGDVKKYLTSQAFMQSFKDKKLISRTYKAYSNPIHTFIGEGISDSTLKLLKKIRKKLKSFQKTTITTPVKPKKTGYVNLGCGTKPIHPWFTGMDQASSANVRMNFSETFEFPFETNSLEVVYSSHFLEHLLEEKVILLIKEVHRTLKPGGVFRLTLPDAKLFFQEYDKRNLHFFDWTRNKGAYFHDSWLRLCIRHFADPVVDQYSDEELHALYKQLGYKKMLDQLCGEIDREGDIKTRIWGHQSWWDVEKSIALLKEIGFTEIVVSKMGQSTVSVLRDTKFFDSTKPHMSFYVEASKPL